jgi:hypothetical protein
MLPSSSLHHGNYASKNELVGNSASKDARFALRQRQRMNFVAVVQSLFLPWILFCVVYAVVAFWLHYSRPLVCWSVVAAAGLIVLYLVVHAWYIIRAKQRNDLFMEPTWIVFLSITTAIGVVVAVMLGNQLFECYMQKYYDYLNLNDYQGVDVSRMRGQQLMDGARMNFVNGTTVDARKAIGFQNLHTYCVAPLTIGSKSGVLSELSSYDFWAIGLDCCSGDSTDFHCGDVQNPNARGGLRLLEEGDRAYYRLAVQQAEAMYHIKADHPLFLYWTEDPLGEMESYKEEAYKYYYISMIVHFFWQLLCVALAVSGFARLGKYS